MPWKETCVMDEKVKFIADWLSNDYSITELSEIYGMSRKTLYKWIGRYNTQGVDGLKDKSSAPLRRPWSTSLEIVSYILAAKSRHSKWGSRKLIAWLKNRHPEKSWPAISTAQLILKREGWVKSRHRRRHTPAYTAPFINSKAPNDVWCADFKGQFRLGDGKFCYPFTLTDSYSRYLLACQGLHHPTYLNTKLYLEQAFKEYGLPLAIRTDNGVPFASVGLGGLSSLAVWLIKLGISPERIELGKPQQNGRHERFHRTLKEAAISPPGRNLAEQQRAFDRFKPEYNCERPHEAQGQKPPASAYQPSRRLYPSKLVEIEYANDLIIRKVKDGGSTKWKGSLVYVSRALMGEHIGFKPIDNGIWEVYYSFMAIGTFDENLGRIIPL